MIELVSLAPRAARAFLFAGAMLAHGVISLAAQEPLLHLRSGDRIRVSSALHVSTGAFVAVNADTLVMRVEPDAERRLAFGAITSLDRSLGRMPAGEALKRGALAGGVGGAVAGGLLGALLCGEPDPCDSGDTYQVILVGAGIVGAIGAAAFGVAYLGYTLVQGERWAPVPLPRHARLEVLPGGRAAVAVRIW